MARNALRASAIRINVVMGTKTLREVTYRGKVRVDLPTRRGRVLRKGMARSLRPDVLEKIMKPFLSQTLSTAILLFRLNDGSGVPLAD